MKKNTKQNYQQIFKNTKKGPKKEPKIPLSFLIKLPIKENKTPGPKYKILGPKYKISGPKRDQKRDKNHSVIPYKGFHQGKYDSGTKI